MQRLDKILSEAGVASRKELKQMIRLGRVQVNGRTALSPEQKYDEATAQILIDGALVAARRAIVLMLNKPAGVVSSTEDPRDKTVLDCLPAAYQAQGLFPVGRLDKETEGLLLLTNDGDLAHRLTSPRHHVQKIYYARHEGTASPEDVQAFSEGLLLRDGTLCRPAELKPLGPGESQITLAEGKYHQVRRMMASRHMTVTYLKRIQIGSLTLGELPCGACRELTRKELEDLT